MYLCERTTDDEPPKTCGKPHKTLPSARRCAQQDGPGLFHSYTATVKDLKGKVLERWESYMKVSLRGRTKSMSARWCLVPAPQTPAPAAGAQ